jgi:hypothetical protein
MKVYLLLFYQDITGTSDAIPEFINVSRNREELEELMLQMNEIIDSEWSPEDLEWRGVFMNSKPYYYILEVEI